MSNRLPRSVEDDALRKSLRDIEALLKKATASGTQISKRVKALEDAPAPAGTLTDNTPRWVRHVVNAADFSSPAFTFDRLLANYPAGTVCEHEWIKPITPFVSPLASIWRLGIKKSGPISSAGGVAKTTDVTTPDAPAQQHANEYIVSDSAAASDWYVTLDGGGAETTDQVTAGQAEIYLKLSLPGSTANTLPAS